MRVLNPNKVLFHLEDVLSEVSQRVKDNSDIELTSSYITLLDTYIVLMNFVMENDIAPTVDEERKDN